MGASRKKLGVPGEDKFIGRGISWCATCDAMFFRDKTVAVVGSGNSAAEEVLVVARTADKVYWLIRGHEIKADAILIKRIKNKDNVTIIYDISVTEILGNQKVTGVKVEKKTDTKAISDELSVDGVFIAIGLQTNSLLVSNQLDLESNGRIATHTCTCATSVSGVFAAGDVEQEWQQLVVAAGRGARAAGSAE
jgi:thioredoxin reductase (NADPH)